MGGSLLPKDPKSMMMGHILLSLDTIYLVRLDRLIMHGLQSSCKNLDLYHLILQYGRQGRFSF